MTEDVGAEDFSKRWMGWCLRVIGYWINGSSEWLLWFCRNPNATQLVTRVCDSKAKIFSHAPYGSQPVDACEAANSGIENDRVEFGHIVGGEQSLGEGLHRVQGIQVDFFGMEEDAMAPIGR